MRWHQGDAYDVEVVELTAMPERPPNVHNGEVRLEACLQPMDLSQDRLAREIHVPPRCGAVPVRFGCNPVRERPRWRACSARRSRISRVSLTVPPRTP